MSQKYADSAAKAAAEIDYSGTTAEAAAIIRRHYADREDAALHLARAVARLLPVLAGTIAPRPWEKHSPLAETEQALNAYRTIMQQ